MSEFKDTMKSIALRWLKRLGIFALALLAVVAILLTIAKVMDNRGNHAGQASSSQQAKDQERARESTAPAPSASSSDPTPSASPSAGFDPGLSPVTTKVVQVVDATTVIVEGVDGLVPAGSTASPAAGPSSGVVVKLLGVSAPACMQRESSDRLSAMLSTGTEVTVGFDPLIERLNSDGQVLGYVSADGEDVASEQLWAGYLAAGGDQTGPAPVRAQSYARAAEAANVTRTGAWASCE